MSSHRDPSFEEVTTVLFEQYGCVSHSIAGTQLVLKRGRLLGTLPMGRDAVPVEVLEVTLRALDIGLQDFWQHLG